MDQEEIRRILIKIENERKEINETINSLTQDEIKLRIAEIEKINNGDCYKHYIDILIDKLTT
jgi:hypothetical protein